MTNKNSNVVSPNSEISIQGLKCFEPGDLVRTPSGRLAVVLGMAQGTGKGDPFIRFRCQYKDCSGEDGYVTLQPSYLRRVC